MLGAWRRRQIRSSARPCSHQAGDLPFFYYRCGAEAPSRARPALKGRVEVLDEVEIGGIGGLMAAFGVRSTELNSPPSLREEATATGNSLPSESSPRPGLSSSRVVQLFSLEAKNQAYTRIPAPEINWGPPGRPERKEMKQSNIQLLKGDTGRVCVCAAHLLHAAGTAVPRPLHVARNHHNHNNHHLSNIPGG